MAVVIASALDKDIAGAPLFRDVSFKLERRDRMTLAGRNGAGKTTLLRMLAGETGVDGGELVLDQGQRDPRSTTSGPPRERDATLRDYVLSGCGELVALEQRLGELEAAMGERPDDDALLDRYAKRPGPARARGRLGLAGARARPAARPGLRRRRARPPPRRASRAASSPAPRSRARSRATRTCCCSTSPPTTSTSRRSSGSRATSPASTPRWCSWRTTAGSSRRWARRCSSSRRAGRASSPAPGTPGAGRRRARAPARQRDREAAGGDRAHGALHRALPGQGDQGAPGAVAREGDRADGPDRARPARHALARLPVRRRPSGPGAWCSRSRTSGSRCGGRTLLEDGELWLERGEHVSLVGPTAPARPR